MVTVQEFDRPGTAEKKAAISKKTAQNERC